MAVSLEAGIRRDYPDDFDLDRTDLSGEPKIFPVDIGDLLVQVTLNRV